MGGIDHQTWGARNRPKMSQLPKCFSSMIFPMETGHRNWRTPCQVAPSVRPKWSTRPGVPDLSRHTLAAFRTLTLMLTLNTAVSHGSWGPCSPKLYAWLRAFSRAHAGFPCLGTALVPSYTDFFSSNARLAQRNLPDSRDTSEISSGFTGRFKSWIFLETSSYKPWKSHHIGPLLLILCTMCKRVNIRLKKTYKTTVKLYVSYIPYLYVNTQCT